ncbi:MAG: DnaJ domain-containing protein [Haloferacaceae archaeon]
MSADFYDLLEVDEDADEEELKRAYRSAVRRYHPDVNDREDADAQFKVVKRAYETLSNPKERARYDRLGHRSYVREQLGGLPTTVVSAVGDGESGRSTTESGADSTGSSTGSSRWDRSAGGSGSSSAGSTVTGSKTTGATATGSTATGSTATGSTTTSTKTDPTNGSTTSGTTATSNATGSTATSNATGSTATSNATGSTATESKTAGSTASRRTSKDVGPGARTGGAAGNGTGANAAASGATGRRNGTGAGAAARGTNGHSTAAGTAAPGAGTAGAAATGEDWTGNGDAKSTGETTADTAASPHTEDPHRVGLRRGLYFSVGGFLAYIVGLLAYLASNAGILASLVAEATAAPGATLLAGAAFSDPIAAVLTAPGTVPAVAFTFGIAALPLTVGTTVLRFGRGTARLYAVAVLAPTAWLLLASDVPFAAAGVARPTALSGGLPVGATALLLAAIPVGATIAFVVDVGRYLRAR